MGWSHADISLEDLLSLIKGFADILVLASGYQSSGLPATWDAENIKRALQWGLFFEDVLRRLHDSVDYKDLTKELDAALLDLASNSYFPKGLACMSSNTLSTARDLVLRHLLQIHPSKNAQLVTFLKTVIEMDIDNLTEINTNAPNVNVDKFMVQMESLNLIPAGKCFTKDSTTSSTIVPEIYLDSKYRTCDSKSPLCSVNESNEHNFVGNSCFLSQELLKRQATMSCISSAETCLDTLSSMLTKYKLYPSGNNPLIGESSHSVSPKNGEMLTESFLWNQWRSKCLLYMLSKRTIRLLSGAKLIFSSLKVQWVRIFEPLKVSTDGQNKNLLEIMEISLLGFISSRWNFVVEHFMSHSFDSISILNQYSDLNCLVQGNFQSFHLKKQTLNSKEIDILEYITLSLISQPGILWQLPPLLVAAIPSWSILFKFYLGEIEKQVNGVSSLIRCCDCNQDGREHKDCEVAERIRCLHMFHIKGSFLVAGDRART